VASKKLNAEQIKAIEHDRGPLLVIAGAGTGKTTVVTERVCRLINKGSINPNEILALTFTEKAAREMEERVDIALPYGYTNMWIMTFHSFCDQILRQEALHIGLDPRFKLASESETTQLIRQHIFDFDLKYFRPRGNPTKFISAMLTHFSRLQDEDVSAKKYLNYAKRIKKTDLKSEKFEAAEILELAKAYKTYEELKISEGVMDFGDLIVKTLELFRSRPNVLARYQKQFRYILVDEFQDVNFSQYQLAKILAGKSANIMATGDDDQSIYRFRGAAVSNILQFRRDFPKSKMVILTKNYRSTQTILDHAYNLIRFNNPDRLEVVENIDKKLVSSAKKQGESIRFIHAQKLENEVETVGHEIQKLVENGYEYGDIAILVRANNHADSFLKTFDRFGIPHQFLGPGKLFKEPEIVDLISYLKVLYNPEDSVSLYRVLNLKHFNLKERDLVAILSYSKKYNLTLFEACENFDEIKIKKVTKDKINEILVLINTHLKKMKDETAGQILYDFLDKTGYIKSLLRPDTPNVQKSADNISRLFDKLKSYEAQHDDASVPAVVDWIELSLELGESPLSAGEDWTQVNAVNLLTVHAAKGLEFPVVFLVNLVSERFPTRIRSELLPIPESLIAETLPAGNFQIQEERRLFYVGMTRAKERLFFTASDFYGEAKRKKKLSQFIFEALGTNATSQEGTVNQQLSLEDFKNNHKPEKNKNTFTHHVHYLSYSQINTFQLCPLHYKLKYILKIPTPPTSQLSLGTSMHAALRDFYASVKAGVKPTKSLIINCLKDNWISLGYQSKKHETDVYQKAEKMLTQYFKKHFYPDKLPLLLEHPFVIPLEKNNGSQKIQLKIGGTMDRVDHMSDGIEIIDYKTGEKVPNQKEVDKNMQLTIYALAATKIKEPPFFDLKPNQIKLSLYYFEEQKKITTTRTKAQLIQLEDELFDIKAQIEASDFSCSGHFYCHNNCEYAMFCSEDLARQSTPS